MKYSVREFVRAWVGYFGFMPNRQLIKMVKKAIEKKENKL